MGFAKKVVLSQTKRTTLSIFAASMVAVATQEYLRQHGAPLVTTLAVAFLSGVSAYLAGRAIGIWLGPSLDARFWARTQTNVIVLAGFALFVSSVVFLYNFWQSKIADLAFALFCASMLIVVVALVLQRITRSVVYGLLSLGGVQLLGFFYTGIPAFLTLGLITSILGILFFVKGPQSLGRDAAT